MVLDLEVIDMNEVLDRFFSTRIDFSDEDLLLIRVIWN
jgi:hypothetical protein